jgi:hypothetical protein
MINVFGRMVFITSICNARIIESESLVLINLSIKFVNLVIYPFLQYKNNT